MHQLQAFFWGLCVCEFVCVVSTGHFKTDNTAEVGLNTLPCHPHAYRLEVILVFWSGAEGCMGSASWI